MLEVPDLLLPEGNVGDPAAMMTLHGTGSQGKITVNLFVYKKIL